MKTHAVAFLFALIFAAPLTPAQEPRPPIRDGSGELLQHPSIVKFDGQVFDVAHNGGVARVPWEQMPPAWRSGYTFDPDRAADTRRREVLDRLNLRTTKEVMSALEQFRGKQLSLRGTVDLSTYGFFDGYRDARGTHLCFEIRDAGGRAFAFMRKEACRITSSGDPR